MMQRAGFSKAAPVTESDTEVLNPGFQVKALWVGGVGELHIQTRQGGVAGNPVPVTSVLHVGIIGMLIPIAPWKVLVATTATNIVALGD